MVKRLIDIVISCSALIFLLPFFLLVAIAIKISDKGPILYAAKRAGVNGVPFLLFKFRTMRTGADKQGGITGAKDNRIFPVGSFLRASKIDELPQFFNVLKGEMSIVGPRPEGMDIVERYYNKQSYRDTLSVRPGIASPGSIFNYTHSNEYLDVEDVERAYVEKLLPIKLGLELVYIKQQSLIYDLRIMLRTVKVIILIASGHRKFDLPPEYYEAKTLGII